MGNYVIRALTPNDATAIGTLHVEVWKHAYAGMVNQVKLDTLTPESSITRWESKIPTLESQEDGGVRVRCAVDEESGRIAGFVAGGTARDTGPLPTELWALNVHPDFHGRGVARELVAAVIGDSPAYLWVVRDNGRAQSFYRKQGFALDGGFKHDPAWDCDEVRMVRS